eukprot:TRINITY_DN9578_c0_g1_i3.p2 TRINITY_DN9578_c0_g1~~TRINITY_DN9578_c0_g1_i3.p2  ORF type:complete len:121 (-),score=8.35 TRINITY_DN9578_c0_g1_i3:808-1170(-)
MASRYFKIGIFRTLSNTSLSMCNVHVSAISMNVPAVSMLYLGIIEINNPNHLSMLNRAWMSNHNFVVFETIIKLLPTKCLQAIISVVAKILFAGDFPFSMDFPFSRQLLAFPSPSLPLPL